MKNPADAVKTGVCVKGGLDRKFEHDLFKCSTVGSSSGDHEHREVAVVIGVDEAGRGPLAGPVVAAAYALPLSEAINGVQDSKKLCEADRESLFDTLSTASNAVYAIEMRDAKYIDEHNILAATLDAMTAAVLDVIQKLTAAGRVTDNTSVRICIDGNKIPPGLKSPPKANILVDTYVKGDGRVFSIGAASILAKVTRDRVMCEFHKEFPEYNLIQHKGYPTASHQATVKEIGPSRIHRLSFQPIKGLLELGHVQLPEGRQLPPPPKVPAKKRMSVPASKTTARKLIDKGQMSLWQFSIDSTGDATTASTGRTAKNIPLERSECSTSAVGNPAEGDGGGRSFVNKSKSVGEVTSVGESYGCDESVHRVAAAGDDDPALFAVNRRRKCTVLRDPQRTGKRLRRTR
eukprot:Lankesteria_metandrocarpae@DN644_c0_g1_i1.p1